MFKQLEEYGSYERRKYHEETASMRTCFGKSSIVCPYVVPTLKFRIIHVESTINIADWVTANPHLSTTFGPAIKCYKHFGHLMIFLPKQLCSYLTFERCRDCGEETSSVNAD